MTSPTIQSLKDETWPWIRPLIGPRRLQISVVGSSMDGLDRGRPRATAPASRDIGPPRCSPPQAVANADTHSPAVLLAWLSSGDLESVRAAALGVQGLVSCPVCARAKVDGTAWRGGAPAKAEVGTAEAHRWASAWDCSCNRSQRCHVFSIPELPDLWSLWFLHGSSGSDDAACVARGSSRRQ